MPYAAIASTFGFVLVLGLPQRLQDARYDAIVC